MYYAPVQDMLFTIEELTSYSRVQKLHRFSHVDSATVATVLEEAGRFGRDVLAPLNAPGDRDAAVFEAGKVRTAAGFKEAYKQFAKNGWQSLAHDSSLGGQGLPGVLAAACEEIWHAANMSFALCPMLTEGAIKALNMTGSETLKRLFATKLVSGEWTGTMNLTEPQAGSDLSLVRTRAERQADGTYKIFGTKIFITYGEHDFTDNIIHLVLARVNSAPAGVKGLSLFVVPKFLVEEDGGIGSRNDVACVSIEHKLGIKASPTAVLQFGDAGGAVGYLVGEENRGLEYMFIMMNSARFSVGIQGVGLSERAYQQALAYACERRQGRDEGTTENPTEIINHPDVRRQLATMRASVEVSRALAYSAAAFDDLGKYSDDAFVRNSNAAKYEFMVPIVKGCCTEAAVDVASAGVQVHGGMGYIEETGAAQYYRDARILPIYEGTTGIQAADFVGRKIARDKGRVGSSFITEMEEVISELEAHAGIAFLRAARSLYFARRSFGMVIDFVLRNYDSNRVLVLGNSALILKLSGLALGGLQMARTMLAASRRMNENRVFFQSKLEIADFYMRTILPTCTSLEICICNEDGSGNHVPSRQALASV